MVGVRSSKLFGWDVNGGCFAIGSIAGKGSFRVGKVMGICLSLGKSEGLELGSWEDWEDLMS